MKHVLSGLGYKVKTVSDPVVALEMLDSSMDDFDVMIVD